MVLVTDWNFRSNEDSRAPAEEADEEEALLLPPPPPAAIFPVCTSAAAPLAAAAAAAGAGKNNHCECVKAVVGEGGQGLGMVHALGSSGGRTGGPATGHAGDSYTLQGGAAGFKGLSELFKGLCLNQSVITDEIMQILQSLSKRLAPKLMVLYSSALKAKAPPHS